MKLIAHRQVECGDTYETYTESALYRIYRDQSSKEFVSEETKWGQSVGYTVMESKVWMEIL